jgi:hypothetical protein
MRFESAHVVYEVVMENLEVTIPCVPKYAVYGLDGMIYSRRNVEGVMEAQYVTRLALMKAV